ncbi:MAG TPA: tripartite tricarboxylate transporter substrate binding protein [Burkholderiales bacterium]|nr:tripartite tricarboxylate transporter substrate binding protein [Burkholderiales bacterium]
MRALLAIALACCASTGFAQSYPSGPMRIIAPYPPGGGTDVLARAIAQKLNERFGHNVIVENRPGANGTVGTGVAAKAAPDGHTMVVVAAAYAAGASLYRNLPYDPAKDLAPVTRLASGPLVLVVHPSLPVRSTKDFVALAKSRPGQINVGNSGTGSLPHLTAELLGSMSGIKLVHVPYKGPGLALIDVLSGQVPAYFMNVIGAMPLVKSNKLRALGVSSPARSPIAPELPTIAEAGFPDFDMTNWYGLLVPSATPRDVVAKLQQEIARIMNLSESKELMSRSGMSVVASTPQQFSEFLSRETVKYERVIKRAGVRQE